ncbi:hypothetical protein [Actinoplanes utahensis]|uniref:Uncharacterized protein n=1 Tax=Actinoplanes utahensis TaxID=1869 RepID=A0A0A6UPZ5_ACTUT|nr:hypothetical protein [Actinoplanes utahensis]KHD78205.1 hypothetical protein MB27_07120 [Actinoplanes utahensis]GIF30723.1 hypothetical protein Aut01nite_37090 [Actinoplanes utahensis]
MFSCAGPLDAPPECGRGGRLDASGGSGDRLRLPFVASERELSTAVSALATAWKGYTGAAVAPPLPAIAVRKCQGVRA